MLISLLSKADIDKIRYHIKCQNIGPINSPNLNIATQVAQKFSHFLKVVLVQIDEDRRIVEHLDKMHRPSCRVKKR